MHILIATDAQWVLDELEAALSSPSTTIQVVTNGSHEAAAVAEQTTENAILDLQI